MSNPPPAAGLENVDVSTAGDLTDISNSPAYTFLEDLHIAGKLTNAQVELYKSKYAKLYEIVLTTYENEKNLLKKAKGLNQELLAERVKLEKAGVRSAEDGAAIVKLRGELSKAEQELAICEEREAMLRLETQELQRLKGEAEQDLQAKKKALQDLVEPQINAINGQIEEIKSDMAKNKTSLTKLNKEKQDHLSRIDQIAQHKLQMSEEREEQTTYLHKLKQEPDKVKKQADVVSTALQSLETEGERTKTAMAELDGIASSQNKQRKALEDEKLMQQTNMEKTRVAHEQRELQADQIRRNLQHAIEDANTAMGDRVQYDLELKAKVMESKRENESLLRYNKEKETVLKRERRAEHLLHQTEEQVPILQRSKEDCHRQLEHLKSDKKKIALTLDELRREVDIYINNFLKQETLEKEKTEKLSELVQHIKELEKEVAALSAQEHILNKEISELGSQREIKAREAGKAMARFRETKEDIKVKDLVIMDLGKKNAETTQRLKEFSQLYEMVKNERNKYVNLIQAASQALAEMKEKIKILQNEIEILKNESLAKDKALAKERQEHQNAFTARDALRSEWNKHMYTYREKQEQVEQQIAEIDKLNSVINQAEKQMVRLKKMYEMAVEDRNYTGIQLIDRNDELCILYEKSNIQENIVKNGEIELRKREEEIRMLKLQVAGLHREIELTRKLLPRIPEFEEQIMELQLQLHDARQSSESLSYQLENAENKARWRRLGGKDPEPDELAAKIRQLEERLNDKKEQLLEKELVLEEVSNLSDRLRKEASDGRSDTLELAKKVNEFQSKIKDTTKRMMATVAELSMYQATAMKLQQDRHQKDIEVEDARWRLEHGQPPTEDAEREFYHMERERMRRREEAIRRAELKEQEELMAGTQITRTTAEPRPNAYIPDDIAIPRPYGALAPFKPSDPGTNIRHFRKPQPREIQI